MVILISYPQLSVPRLTSADFPDAMLNEQLSEVRYPLLAIEHNDLSTATKHIDAADVHGNAVTVAYVRGNIALQRGEFQEALDHYTSALKHGPNHIRARMNRCSVLMALNQPKKALDDAQILVDLAPSLVLARLRRSEALMHLGEWEQARDDLKMALDESPHHYQALTKLASCYMALERPERPKLDEDVR